jgi:hypothetical protein
MINLLVPSDDDPVLGHSKLLVALEKTLAYARDNHGIGLTQSKAFNRKFAHWAADNFDWPEYGTERLMELNKVLDEQDVLPVMVLHEVLVLAKLGRHVKQRFVIGTKAAKLMASRGQLFGILAQTYLFQYNHNRTSRFDYAGLGNWDIFFNIINVEAEQGLTEQHLVKTLYGLEKREHVYDREYHDHAGFLFSHVLRPLSWIGFLDEQREGRDLLRNRTYWKTPLWRACLRLDTDHYLEAPEYQQH